MMNLFVKWMHDNYDSIEQYFIPNIPECFILPEIMIYCFYDSSLFNLENVLMDTENGYKNTKITRNFIIKCLKIKVFYYIK